MNLDEYRKAIKELPPETLVRLPAGQLCAMIDGFAISEAFTENYVSELQSVFNAARDGMKATRSKHVKEQCEIIIKICKNVQGKYHAGQEQARKLMKGGNDG